MRMGLSNNERHVREIGSIEVSCTSSRNRWLDRRWRVFPPIVVMAFAALISSCEDAKKTDASQASKKIDASQVDEANGILDMNTEDLLGRAGITAVEAEARSEDSRGRRLDCLVTLSQDRKTNQTYIKILVPLSGTYEERFRDAASPEKRKQLIGCYKAFNVELPQELAADSGEMGFAVSTARADDGVCPKPAYGSCGGGSTGHCCAAPD